MSLNDLKRRLAIDQRNLIRGEIIEVVDATCRVRLADGRTITAGLGGLLPNPGDLVEVATAGSAFMLERKAPLAALDGERVVEL